MTQHGLLHKYKVTSAGYGGVAGSVGACVWILGASHNLHIAYGSISIDLQVQVLAGPLMVAAGSVATIAAAVGASYSWATVP